LLALLAFRPGLGLLFEAGRADGGARIRAGDLGAGAEQGPFRRATGVDLTIDLQALLVLKRLGRIDGFGADVTGLLLLRPSGPIASSIAGL